MILLVMLMVFATSVLIAFYSHQIAWTIIAATSTCLLILCAIAKSQKWKHVDTLSPEANALIRKYGHFYSYPMTSKSYSGAAALMMFCGVIVAGIGAFQGWWWGFGFAAVNWSAMGYVSRTLNPIRFIRSDEEVRAHEEVLNFKAKVLGVDP